MRGTRGRILGAGAVAAALMTLAACAPPLGRPGLKLGPFAPRVFDASDPAVLVTGGKTYLYGSTNNMKLPVREITSFTGTLAASQTAWANSPRDAMPSRPAWVDASEWQIWAPSVARISGKYYVYFAGRRGGTVSDENNDQCIGRGVATNPLGPFTPESSPVYCGLPREGAVGGQPPSNSWGRGALDPEFFRAPDGKLYLLVSLSRTRDNVGVIRLDSAGRPTGGVNASPTILAGQAYGWHDGTVDSTMGSGAFLENPTMAHDPLTDTYLLWYSAGQWYTRNYVTGFARCASPTGPCTLDSRGPFLVNGNGRTGVGGFTAFRDASGTLRAAYASWTAGKENQSGAVGEYSRQVSWARVYLTNTSDASQQTVTLLS